MLEQALTTDCCGDIISMLLKRRGWTIQRIARVMDRPVEYVRRVQLGKQSFQLVDVEALAKALKVKPYRLVFDSFQRENYSAEMRGLYDLVQREVESHEEFARVLNRKTTKKKRAGKKAA